MSTLSSRNDYADIWGNVKRKPMDGRILRPAVHQMTHEQCDRLAEIAAELKPSERIEVVQTITPSGGTHLYVRIGTQEWHLPAHGKPRKLGPVT